jgi:UDP-N-acetylmuramoyl-tripeptide--D-alanyl-D-alanine ligase
MEQITIDDVVKATAGKLTSKDSADENLRLELQGVSIDSRRTNPGDLFVALKGKRSDGHSFVKQARQKGACAAIVSQSGPLANDLPLIVVQDTLKALGDLAAWHRARFSLPVVAITGSNGKTTTKELTAKCLGIRYEVLKSERSLNSLTGVPLSLLNLTHRHSAGVFEVGTNRKGEIARLAGIVEPKIAVITNIAPTHLEHFATVEGVLSEKLELTRSADTCILNADDPLLSKASMKAFTFGMKKGDLRAELVESSDKTRFRVEDVPFELPLPGLYQVYNALAALSVGIHFDLRLREMASALKDAKSLPHREEVLEIDGIKIIDGTYNANPVSMELALRQLGTQKATRRIAVLGDMLELGRQAHRFHTDMGKILEGLGIDVMIGFGELARGYAEKAVVPQKFHFTDISSLKHQLKEIVKPGDVILIKGSRGMRMERIVDCLKD